MFAYEVLDQNRRHILILWSLARPKNLENGVHSYLNIKQYSSPFPIIVFKTLGKIKSQMHEKIGYLSCFLAWINSFWFLFIRLTQQEMKALSIFAGFCILVILLEYPHWSGRSRLVCFISPHLQNWLILSLLALSILSVLACIFYWSSFQNSPVQPVTQGPKAGPSFTGMFEQSKTQRIGKSSPPNPSKTNILSLSNNDFLPFILPAFLPYFG